MTPIKSLATTEPCRSFLCLLQTTLLVGLSTSPSVSARTLQTPVVARAASSRNAVGGLASARVKLFQFQTKVSLAANDAISRLSPPSEFSRLRAQFEEPLISTSSTSSEEDDTLLRALKNYQARTAADDLSPLRAFLKTHPRSGWRVALLTNIGLADYHYGYFSGALDAWEEAWEEGRSVNELHGRALVDRAIGELIRMHSRLGHADRVGSLLDELGDRPVSGPATEAITNAREALWLMRHEPGVAFLCGPFALRNLLLSEHVKPSDVGFLNDYRSGPQGVRLDQVNMLADEARYPHRLIFRKPGQPVPVPSVVHWKVNHFAAIIAEANGRFHVQDPTFGTDLWITRSAIDAEASGYFLIPASAARMHNWRVVESDEASHVHGMGVTSLFDTLATLLNDIFCLQCTANAISGGMATYNMHEMLVSLHISDTPVGYNPPIGPSVKVMLVYNQREAAQPANFTYFNVSQKWTINWLAYIVDDPAYAGANVMRYAAGGGAVQYSGYNSANGTFTPETRDASVLVRTSANPITYQRRLADGSVEIYSHSDGSTGSTRRIFLTQIVDPQGNAVTLNYDNQLRLTSITDATGRNTTFSYGLASNPLLITQITDPFNRSAQLDYDTSGRLIQITDVLGLTSQFTYDSSSLIDVMTTPYGTTKFAYGSTNGNERYLQVTDPLGYTEKLEYLQNAPGIAYSDPSKLIPTGMLGPWNNYLYGRDTWYWDKHAYPLVGGNYLMARNRHWAHESDGNGNPASITSHVVEAIKYPFENRVWMNYEGQTAAYSSAVAGTFDTPTNIGRVLDDGTTQLTQNKYNTLGQLTDTIDPVGRETKIIYAANNIDPITIQQKTSASGYSTIAQFTYNNQHLPLTYIDAAGQTTSYQYNSDGQMTQMTDAQGEVTSYDYDSLGRLSTVTNANGQTQASFTYDADDRVATATDSEGYTIQFAYDAFDRVTQTTFPDGTTRQYNWDKLDLASVKTVRATSLNMRTTPCAT